MIVVVMVVRFLRVVTFGHKLFFELFSILGNIFGYLFVVIGKEVMVLVVVQLPGVVRFGSEICFSFLFDEF